VAGGGSPGVGSGGKLGRSKEGVGEEWGQGTSGAARAGSERLGGSAAEGKEEGKGGGPGRGGATRREGAVGPGPDWRASPGSGPSAPLVGDVRFTRACRPDRAGREGADRWAAAQCRATVPLTGGAGLSVGAVESAGARGPAREESGVAEPR
jgi:hypothetical protein